MKTGILNYLKSELSVIVAHTSIDNLDRQYKIVQAYFNVMKQIRDLPTIHSIKVEQDVSAQLVEMFSFIDSGNEKYPYNINLKKKKSIQS